MSGRILYIEPFSGASGDMFLSALCSLTDSHTLIVSLPGRLGLEDGKVEVREVNKNGIVCKHVKIIDLNPQSDHHHHDHGNHHHHEDHHHHHGDHHHHHHFSDYLKMIWRRITRIFGHHHHHGHVHPPEGDHHHHGHQRGLSQINRIIDDGDISKNAKIIAREIFRIVGESESRIHNIPIDKIHFHELSGVDSILDIVGCAVLLDQLKIEKTYCDPICTGYGYVRTQHGMLPVPAPATNDILQGMPVYKGMEKGEKLTPTGAAILKYLKPSFDVPVIECIQVAYGPGEKDFVYPNVIRTSLVKEVKNTLTNPDKEEEMMMIDCNVDDGTAEYLGSEFQKDLLRNGAVDLYFTSTQMKKGRPGLMLSVLVAKSNLDQVSEFILDNTSTIGVRYYPVNRMTLPRKTITMQTKYGSVNVKEVMTPSGKKRHKIEFESILRLKNKYDLNLADLQKELYQELFNQQK